MLEGALTAGVLPTLLRDLYVGRRTGRLSIRQSGGAERALRFREGRIVGASSSVLAEHLGEQLVRQGRLSQLDLDRATELVTSHGVRLGQALLELGAVEASELEDLLAQHARGVLLAVLAAPEGGYAFEEQDLHQAPLEDVTLKLSTAEMILEAVRSISDAESVRFGLGDRNRALAPSSDPLLRFQKIQLSPTDGYVLSRVDGTLSVNEVAQLIPLPVEDVERSLLGLLCTGVIELSQLPPRGQKAARQPATAPSPRPEPGARPPGSAAAPPTSSPVEPVRRPAVAPAPAPAPRAVPVPARPVAASAPPPGPSLAERRREIEEMLASLKGKNHFELLGVPRASNEAQVKEAYFRLARRFHPDATRQDQGLADLHDDLETIFIRVGEAYEVLRDTKRRSAYESDLASRAPRSVAPPPGAAPAPQGPAAPDPAAEAQQVDSAIATAEGLIAAEKFWDAIQLLEHVQPLARGKQSVRLRYVLAKAVGRNPHWVKRAEELLVSVVKDDASHVGAHWLLAGIYRKGGLRARATSMLRRVVELQPDHEEATAALRELAPEPEPQPEPEPPPSGGLLKRLFGKGGGG